MSNEGSLAWGTEGIRSVYARTVDAMPDFRLRGDSTFGSRHRALLLEWTMWATAAERK